MGAVVITMVLMWLSPVIIAGVALFWLMFAAHRAQRTPKPRPAPPVVTPKPEAPRYIRRWGSLKTSSVAADKADWEKDFERLLRL